MTTLRNVIGGMQLEETLTSRDNINAQLRGVLDEATGKWGIRVNRVELKAVDPPGTIKDAMEKQMRADRDKRAAILTAEGVKQSQILTAEGEKQSAILKAEGQRQALVLQAEGQSKAIETVFKAIHDGDADPKLLAYQYLQMLPQIAEGDANKIWIIPSEITQALGQLTKAIPRAHSDEDEDDLGREVGRGLGQRRDRADADVLAVEELEPGGERPCGERLRQFLGQRLLVGAPLALGEARAGRSARRGVRRTSARERPRSGGGRLRLRRCGSRRGRRSAGAGSARLRGGARRGGASRGSARS